MFKKISFRIIAIFIGVITPFLLFELFFRLYPAFGYIYNSLKTLSCSEAPMLQQFVGCALRPSLLLGYENIPNSEGINSYGLVGREYRLKKDNNTFRILLLGDSIAWQQGWASEYLESLLNNSLLSVHKYKFEIWNAAVPSYDIRRYALYLKHKGLRYKPDMVLIYLFMNDFGFDTNVYYKTKDGATAYYFPLSEVTKKLTVNPVMLRHSHLYRWLMLKYNTYLSNIKNSNSSDEPKYYLGMIKGICSAYKIKLFVVVFPYLKPVDKYEKYQISEYTNILDTLSGSGIKYISLYDNLQHLDLYSLRFYKDDEMHPSQEGHKVIARIIYNYLMGDFLNLLQN